MPLFSGNGGTGIKFSGDANFSKEREHQDGSAWSEGIVDAGNQLTITTGNNANIVGGQLKGDSVVADIGNNLNIQSLQDTDNYDYEKISASISGSYTYGSNDVEANLSLSQTEMESNWASVTDQAGIFAGQGGYDITVGNNTDLKGAVIASEAEDKTLNKLDTGTISFSDIENKADFDVSHVSVNIGTGSGLSPLGGIPTVYHNSGEDHSTTKSAVEDGTLIVRDEAAQKQDINNLSRDTENANNPLGQIFDKQKELDRMETIELVKDIANQAKDIANKYDRIQAQNVYDNLSKEEQAKTSVDKILAEKSDKIGGMGSSTSKGIDTAVSIVTGLLTGDITGGLAGASAPWLAGIIKENTYQKNEDGSFVLDKDGNKQVDTTTNLVDHAILGATVAQLQGNSALAGGAGALTGEAAAELIYKTLYSDTPKDKLSEADKQNISALAQLAAGLAVAAGTGGDIADTGTAVAGGKNAVENNSMAEFNGGNLIGIPTGSSTSTTADSILSGAANGYLTQDEAIQAYYGLMKGKDMPTGSTEMVLIYSAPGMIAGVAAVTIEAGVATVVGSAAIGLGSNGAYQLISKPMHEFDIVELGVATGIGAGTAGLGWLGTISWNVAGGIANSAIKGENPVSGAIGGGGSGVVNKAGGPILGPIAGEIINDKTQEWINNIFDNNQENGSN